MTTWLPPDYAALAELAGKYMVEHMGMSNFMDDQEQNQIFRHLCQFGRRLTAELHEENHGLRAKLEMMALVMR